MYDFAVYMGRFQPFHDGHLSTLKRGLQEARKVIVLVGSSNLHLSPKNPFTYEEREQFIHWNVDRISARNRVIVAPINDVPYNNLAWKAQVSTVVGAITTRNSSIAILGMKKDSSSFYLDMFPEWGKVIVPTYADALNATDIRNALWDTKRISPLVDPMVGEFLEDYCKTSGYDWCRNEVEFLIDYRKKWGDGPFITTDAVATQSGHILLVTRKRPPFKGCLALPGGFLNRREFIRDGCVRELKEETRISDKYGEIPPGKLDNYIISTEVFDHPDRDPRGRIITHAHRFIFPDQKELFKVRGDDDAEFAQWYPLHDLDPRDFAADHWFIIQKMTGIQWK